MIHVVNSFAIHQKPFDNINLELISDPMIKRSGLCEKFVLYYQKYLQHWEILSLDKVWMVSLIFFGR